MPKPPIARFAPRAALVSGLVSALVLPAALPGCAPGDTPETPVTRAAGVTYGTILGTRPAAPRGAGEWRTRLLAGLGAPGTTAAGSTGGARLVEFVVREDVGEEIATIQPDAEGLAVGDRVTIIRGDRTRLTRAGAAPPPRRSSFPPRNSAAPAAAPT